jgi:predicted nucleotidyltransferase
MQATPYPDIDALLSSLLHNMQAILNTKLVGLYLYGSLVAGDFDEEISDVDLLAATTSDIDAQDFGQLQRMHSDFVGHHPKWIDRIEVAYLSVTALKTFRSRTSRIAVISPGEPFHFKDAGIDWLINWWVIREQGVPLFGPPPTALIEPITKSEFLQAVHKQARDWGGRVDHMQPRKAQAYAILTMCRALYACEKGEQASKPQAARWAAQHIPQWASVIEKALVWRREKDDDDVDHAATLPETVSFVHFVIDRIASIPSN